MILTFKSVTNNALATMVESEGRFGDYRGRMGGQGRWTNCCNQTPLFVMEGVEMLEGMEWIEIDEVLPIGDDDGYGIVKD